MNNHQLSRIGVESKEGIVCIERMVPIDFSSIESFTQTPSSQPTWLRLISNRRSYVLTPFHCNRIQVGSKPSFLKFGAYQVPLH
uniref:Uncharacterized protein n=1 Tax=Rhizophora mucronata TaxID=61149 RepID=A0A2P2NFK6_RHIMU